METKHKYVIIQSRTYNYKVYPIITEVYAYPRRSTFREEMRRYGWSDTKRK